MPRGVRASPCPGFCYLSPPSRDGFESMRLPENTQVVQAVTCKGYKAERMDVKGESKGRKALIYKGKALFVIYIFI